MIYLSALQRLPPSLLFQSLHTLDKNFKVFLKISRLDLFLQRFCFRKYRTFANYFAIFWENSIENEVILNWVKATVGT